MAMHEIVFANTKSRKFHLYCCPIAEVIPDDMKREFNGDLDAFDHGFQPAGCCALPGFVRQWVYNAAADWMTA